MLDSKVIERKEDHFESKTNTCQTKRKIPNVKRIFQESPEKPSRNH